MLQRLVGADPVAWIADVPRVLDALVCPELGVFYLAAAARHPGAFPTGPAEAVHAALTLSRACPLPPTRESPTRRSSPAGRGPVCWTPCGAPTATSAVTCWLF
ncbi:hypothetical protein RND61_02785 [Streptomyces sp. TRM76323]|uniref:Uncharacterized protein n=1 Tax=Streptomyces tamarix TaxID=3078565 RepID=A0ABU3QE27_9ACTN|nr:hypothetical protein [Streptomyces tamarix]MDT9681015.1 hypothetical protein [Streptomyces tamarix]